MNKQNFNLIDFSLINQPVKKLKDELDLKDESLAFMPFALTNILSLQYDEAIDCITDSNYLKNSGIKEGGGHDRGIDAIYIDDTNTTPKIYFFNFKYIKEFKNSNKNFPSNEIDKILSFVSDLMGQQDGFLETLNACLRAKVEDLWNLLESEIPEFELVLASNHQLGLVNEEETRLKKALKRYNNFSLKEYHMPSFLNGLVTHTKMNVNGKLRAIDKNYFEKSDGDIRALIVNLDSRDLLKIICNDQVLRESANVEDYSVLRDKEIDENVFEDNVRLYLKQKTQVNKNIKITALSEDAFRFFYYNNGITITCSNFQYSKSVRSPVIELIDFQIVNGSQTLHSLFDAYKESPENFENIDLLCRIYETKNDDLSISIAEYTNSQNPVKNRDIRANDQIQKKIALGLEHHGFYYVRKKNQHNDKPKKTLIDSEKTGQALLAFYQDKPAEAKDAKRIIFAEEYEKIFNDEMDAEKILLAFQVLSFIEEKKLEAKKEMLTSNNTDSDFIQHASFYILYTMKKLYSVQEENFSLDKIEQINQLYPNALNIIKNAVLHYKAQQKERYNHRLFFKGSLLKSFVETEVDKIKNST